MYGRAAHTNRRLSPFRGRRGRAGRGSSEVVRGVKVEARPALTGPEPWVPAHGREDVRRPPFVESQAGEREPLRESPFGFVLTDAEGHVLSVNDRAATLLAADQGSTGPRDLTCCELICGPLNADGAAPAASGCLTRSAMRAGKALPEARIELNRKDR